MFRAPGRRPPAVLSAAFALLALAPLGLLLAMLRSLGVNLRVRPRSRVLFEPSLSWVPTVAAMTARVAGPVLAAPAPEYTCLSGHPLSAGNPACCAGVPTQRPGGGRHDSVPCGRRGGAGPVRPVLAALAPHRHAARPGRAGHRHGRCGLHGAHRARGRPAEACVILAGCWAGLATW